MKEFAPIRFEIGDMVVAKHDIGESGVLAGDVLQVLKTQDCENCGNQAIDVGIREPAALRCTCTICEHSKYTLSHVTEEDDIWYLNSYNFALYTGEKYKVKDQIYRPASLERIICIADIIES